jgi:hypothetical protein
MTTTTTAIRQKSLPGDTPALTRLRFLQLHSPLAHLSMPTEPITTRAARNVERGRSVGSRIKSRAASSPSLRTSLIKSRPNGLHAFPPYLPVPLHQKQKYRTSQLDLVEGAVCKIILQLLSEGNSFPQITHQLRVLCLDRDRVRAFTAEDIRSIIARCRQHGLTSHMPLESDDWDQEEVEDDWVDQQSAILCDPVVTEDECGSRGWWNQVCLPNFIEQCRLTLSKLEDLRHRSWKRWPSIEIGPRRLRTGESF